MLIKGYVANFKSLVLTEADRSMKKMVAISYASLIVLKPSENSNRPMEHSPDPQLSLVYEGHPFIFVFVGVPRGCSTWRISQLGSD